MLKKSLVLIFVFAVLMSFSTLVCADDRSASDYKWTGPYVGLNGGWTKATARSSTTSVFYPNNTAPAYLWAMDQPAFNTAGNPTLRNDSFVGGIQGGYNLQFGKFVLGAEMDFNSMNINNNETLTTGLPSWGDAPATFRSSIDTDWLLTARPRIAYAFENFLFYATGGLALTEIKAKWAYFDQFKGLGEYASKSKVKAGWTLGGGIEVGLWKNWSVKGEYLYADFGKVSGSGIFPSFNSGGITIQPQPLRHKMELKTHVLRAGLNYRF